MVRVEVFLFFKFMELEVFNLYDDFVVLREGDDYEVIINYVNYNIRF